MTTGPSTQTGGGATKRRASLIAPGQVIAGRYEIRRLLGRGGMGRVWLAYDVKLRVDVALKDLAFTRDRSAEMVRREVRAAREVVSPNVCRIFDLVEADGRELVSMEYVDGRTLRHLLEERSPLELSEAQPIASQFLAGLEAIHAANLVHRDLKPENLMITRTGRVVIMDFGLAREVSNNAHSMGGTPAYMAPEQASGEPIDARSDIFAAGVVLAEMVTPSGARTGDSRMNIWTGIRHTPPSIADTPWSIPLRKAVCHDRLLRFDSARELSRALDEITVRAVVAEDKQPYPGLTAFSASQAQFFFGREAELEAMLRKLGRFHLLALIGSSGAGKSSFLQAGVLPMLPKSWSVLLCRPGSSAFVSLRHVLATELVPEPDLAHEMLRFHEVEIAASLLRRWRIRNPESLLVIDQFEELFTLNPVETRLRFIDLLALAMQDGIRVLLSLRDDFLIHCHEYDALAPIFTELTPLCAPSGTALRRALVQPALLCGYRFEDEALVEEMLDEVGSGRGKLPLLAFAASQLWRRRNRDNGTLTRAAYDEIGGVSGALAQHAEETLEGMGNARILLVREIFRNLVTAQRTRAARDRDELLSVFSASDRAEAEAILETLVAARLLTSFEVVGESETRRRIEIVHESLLTAWPRLVHWQAQDAEGATMRDQVRQAAQLWVERGRDGQLLWNGNAYREFLVWKARYPGALSALEEAFGHAMTVQAERTKRRIRYAIASMVTAALLVTGMMTLLWRRSVATDAQARGEARRAEAQKLLALSQVEIDRFPTAALAYAIKSLEVADSAEARHRVMEILWRGPIARVLNVGKDTAVIVKFSPDGAWLAAVSPLGSDALVPADGGPIRRIPNPPAYGLPSTLFSDDNRFLVVHGGDDPLLRVFSIPDLRLIRTIPNDQHDFTVGRRIITVSLNAQKNALIRSWPFSQGDPTTLGRVEKDFPFCITSDGAAITYGRRQSAYQQRVADPMEPSQVLWDLGRAVVGAKFYDGGNTLAVRTSDGLSLRLHDGSIRSMTAARFGAEVIPLPSAVKGSRVVLYPRGKVTRFSVWDLAAPPASTPLQIRWPVDYQFVGDLSPSGDWLATSTTSNIAFWPLTQQTPRVITSNFGFSSPSNHVFFTPDSGNVVTCGSDGGLQRWALAPPETPALNIPLRDCLGATIDRNGRNIIAGGQSDGIFLISLAGDRPRRLLDQGGNHALLATAFDPTGEFAAVHLAQMQDPTKRALQIINLRSGAVRSLPVASAPEHGSVEYPILNLGFAFDGTLYSSGNDGIRRWSVTSRTAATFRASPSATIAMSGNGRSMLAALRNGRAAEGNTTKSELVLFDLEHNTERRITGHGSDIALLAIDDTGEIIATVNGKGVVRVGKASSEEPHLLITEPAEVWGIAISRDRKWVALATTADIRLFPMPDLSKPPLHKLPYADLMATLRRLTNLRAVADSASPAGYRIDIGPFPGWKDNPAW